ncbi:hypothetical protein PTKIN_Ptkin10aG0153500 [Pterospermum kingtungense]
MSQEAATETQLSMWLTNISHFFHLPNPRIFTLFIISSTATFSLGIAMMVQWLLHGQYHQGFHWMVYTASAITSLPVLIWIMFLLFAICSSPHTSPLSNLSKSHQTQTHHQHTDTEAAAAATTQDDPAMVQPEILNDHSSGFTECKSLTPVSQPRNSKHDNNNNNKQALKRTQSLPLFHVPTQHYCNFKRSRSLKQ